MDSTFFETPALNGLKANWGSMPEASRKLVAGLVANGQQHLFAEWDAPGTADAEKAAFLESLAKVDRSYPGGLEGYIANARKLLAEAKEGKNAFIEKRAPQWLDQ